MNNAPNAKNIETAIRFFTEQPRNVVPVYVERQLLSALLGVAEELVAPEGRGSAYRRLIALLLGLPLSTVATMLESPRGEGTWAHFALRAADVRRLWLDKDGNPRRPRRARAVFVDKKPCNLCAMGLHAPQAHFNR